MSGQNPPCTSAFVEMAKTAYWYKLNCELILKNSTDFYSKSAGKVMTAKQRWRCERRLTIFKNKGGIFSVSHQTFCGFFPLPSNLFLYIAQSWRKKKETDLNEASCSVLCQDQSQIFIFFRKDIARQQEHWAQFGGDGKWAGDTGREYFLDGYDQ